MTIDNAVEGGPPATRGPNRPVLFGLAVVVVGTLAFVAVMSMRTSSQADAPTGGSSEGAQAATVFATGDKTPAAVSAAVSAHERAGALRRAANLECHGSQWDACRKHLDEAAQLDPDGDKIVQVQRLRKAAAEGTR
jgi:hypothetical protein